MLRLPRTSRRLSGTSEPTSAERMDEAGLRAYVGGTWGPSSLQAAFLELVLAEARSGTKFLPPSFLRERLSDYDPAEVDAAAIGFSTGFPRLLQLRYHFSRDEVEFDLELEEVLEAKEEGYLVNPDTDREYRDFERSLYPYFAPSSALVGLLE